ncbi:MAG: 4-(cytidine 5'-diphospho)-2-C-methyl-D-erythritol kinase [Prevotellaceae bacterium]|nr:4-(cytidine 5'-diphospho)-2-C-methyl-D-erythritol kinase [Prevotellaceae bacterium]
MISFPNVKINLGLNVISRRKDNYHNIETIFFPVPKLTDILDVVASDKFSFKQTGIHVDASPKDNLCVKAYELLHDRYKLPPAAIHLHKIIPTGAGLGGGSSDASFMLLSLNRIFDLKIPVEQLKEYAALLGSDCAFFIENTPAKASGRGEILEPVQVNINGLYLLLVKPDIHISTKEAYDNIVPQIPEFDISETVKLPVAEWKNRLHNDFEKSIFPLHPTIAAIKDRMYAHGALYSSMSGSGASVFGLFDEKPDIPFGNMWRFCDKL